MAKKMTAYILKSIFYFAIISDIQERCKDGTESSYVSFTSSFTVNLSCYHITFAKLTSQLWASLMALMVKNACHAGNLGSIPRLGRFPWRREWVATSSVLAWKIQWTEKPGRLPSMGSQRVGHDNTSQC